MHEYFCCVILNVGRQLSIRIYFSLNIFVCEYSHLNVRTFASLLFCLTYANTHTTDTHVPQIVTIALYISLSFYSTYLRTYVPSELCFPFILHHIVLYKHTKLAVCYLFLYPRGTKLHVNTF